MSVLSVPPLRALDQDYFYPYEERVAIADMDGNQNPLQAHRIAYLDAFISVLWNLAQDNSHKDWLSQKIHTALTTLEAQGLPTMH